MSALVRLGELTTYLDSYLRVREVPDYEGAVNGLQVENGGTVDRIVAAVDASQATIDGVAALGGSPLLLVHHGLFFDGNLPVTGRRYRRLRTLLAHDVAVYSSHLPLDAHAEVGNNAVLARLLGLHYKGPFGNYRGNPIGMWGLAPATLTTRDALSAALQSVLGLGEAPRLIPGGPAEVQRVGIVTGGAGTMVKEARDAGLDTFITGEGPHHTYFDAMEFGVNVFHAGHYATETVGVKALAEHVGGRFGLPFSFHDHPTGM
jgi:dinuclear metal center YbgI/SA1388 family protein